MDHSRDHLSCPSQAKSFKLASRDIQYSSQRHRYRKYITIKIEMYLHNYSIYLFNFSVENICKTVEDISVLKLILPEYLSPMHIRLL